MVKGCVRTPPLRSVLAAFARTFPRLTEMQILTVQYCNCVY